MHLHFPDLIRNLSFCPSGDGLFLGLAVAYIDIDLPHITLARGIIVNRTRSSGSAFFLCFCGCHKKSFLTTSTEDLIAILLYYTQTLCASETVKFFESLTT